MIGPKKDESNQQISILPVEEFRVIQTSNHVMMLEC